MSNDKVKYVDNWKSKNVDRIVIQSRKALSLPDKLDTAVKMGKAPSKQAYIIAAVLAALERDGIDAPTKLNNDDV